MSELIVDTTGGILDARTTGEVIRCLECEWCNTHPDGTRVCKRLFLRVHDDDFCSRATRRGSGDLKSEADATKFTCGDCRFFSGRKGNPFEGGRVTYPCFCLRTYADIEDEFRVSRFDYCSRFELDGAEPEGPSASMADPVREARDAYMRMHGGITSSGMGKYRYVTDAEEGNGC
jgi:hypothetical protein